MDEWKLCPVDLLTQIQDYLNESHAATSENIQAVALLWAAYDEIKKNRRLAPENKPLTVGDHFRSLTNEELAGLLIDAEGAGYNDSSIAPEDEHGYHIDMLDWLNQPYIRKPEQEKENE